MRRLLPLLALLHTACAEKPPPGSTPKLQGSLTIHTHHADRADWRTRYPSVYVLLGDGSRFLQPLDDQGTARFEDPSLVGAQDVTVVEVQGTGGLVLHTLLAVDEPELELPYGYNEPFSTAIETKQAQVTGKVTGASGAGTVSTQVVSEAFSGRTPTQTAPPGTFSLEVWGATPGRLSLFASETRSSDHGVLRVGMKRDVAVGGGQAVTGQDIALDHPVDQTLGVTVTGLEPYGTRVNAFLTYSEGTQELFSTGTTSTPPLSLPAIARTAPFDTTQMRVGVGAGDEDTLPAGFSEATLRVGAASPVAVTLLAPVLLSSPVLGTRDAVGTASRDGFAFRWSADPTARFVKLAFMNFSRTGDKFIFWDVLAPASTTSFTPFQLPEGVAPRDTLEAGLYAIEARSLDYGDGHGVWDYIQYSLNPDPLREQRETEVQGYVMVR
ncbi:putative lipoprotein [Cystobacter fuscus DSM 2262]|uniref:Lipoprotein n=1 Tax=Cystobacter fuscus (strain ATCC 25194 / DSM 2262 / NBRC 100088 / M29) TaxID=1242864 RepID=S9QR37_CYSF2|nr:hypothetical protein [Cystobacter fuscus]EPX63769.1 putative lipoprotein [Cystobacter fuscus DSM 2262]